MDFEEFKKRFLEIAKLDGIEVTDEELAKLFISNLVINSFEKQQIMKSIRKKSRKAGMAER
ncbi:hypothetical protein OXB_2843 [Bacillus sp. OxB-1]|uniref:hypothetical protein n=1 Tax=Bacillus sp. (strain OxB-1) TaxID=98228 RepID=UPI000582371B|nr:hypothetical protein [Bacillus sp. OxB-1]BAQ11314.1 hypothetical protein OXB_2843 [Bacillus sp. OxB-1]